MDRMSMEKTITQIKEIPFLTSDAYYRDQLREIDAAFEKKPFRIAMVGEFSTGKSTFINALLGRDLLLHAVSEVTATITNIHNVSKTDKRWHSCDVTFADGKIEHLEDDSKLIDYTTTKSSVTKVVSSVKSVDYYTDFMEPDVDVIIVDTPGLNGMSYGHRELTLAEVKRAYFCIYLAGIKGLAETDKILLKEMSYYQKNFVFVMNFIDQLKLSEGETVEEKIEEIEDFLQEDIFNECNINYEIFGVSALKGLAGKDRNVKRLYERDTKDIEDSERALLYKESRLGAVEAYIGSHINNSTIDELTIDRVRHMLVNIVDDAIEELENRKERIDYLRSMDGDEKKLQRMEEKLRFFVESSKKNKEKVINYAESECSAIRREFKDYLRSSLENMKSKCVNKFMEYKNYNDLEDYIKSKGLESDVKVATARIYDDVEGKMLPSLNVVLNNILSRMQEYLKDPQIADSNQIINFEVQKGINRSDSKIMDIKTELETIEWKKSAAREKAKSAQNILENEAKIRIGAAEGVARTRSSLQKAEMEKQRKISNIGAQPAVETKTTYSTQTYYVEVEREGIWGALCDIFMSPKKERRTRQVPHIVSDDSKRKAWVQKRDNILSSSKREIDRLESALEAESEKLSKAEKREKNAKKDLQQANDDVVYYQQQYEAAEKRLALQKKAASEQLLNELRKSVISQLDEHCDFDNGAIATVIKEYIEDTVEDNRKIICEKTAEFYDNRLEALVRTYQNQIDGKVEENNQKYADYENDICELKHRKEELSYAG